MKRSIETFSEALAHSAVCHRDLAMFVEILTTETIIEVETASRFAERLNEMDECLGVMRDQHAGLTQVMGDDDEN